MQGLDQYDYDLPTELIAKEPATPRDSSRLFVYDTASDTVTFDAFSNIGEYLPPKTLLVMNDTKVVPARLWLTKETGGKIEVLLFMNELAIQGPPLNSRAGLEFPTIKGIVDRKVDVGAKLYFKHNEVNKEFNEGLTFKSLEVVHQEEQFFFFKPSVSLPEVYLLLEKEGVTPIPPYIKESPLNESTLREKYQSIFAKNPASVAAPTASLHFTPELMEKLEERGVDKTFVTLHVGAGTFAPIDEKNFQNKKLFTEYYEVSEESAKKINAAKNSDVKIIPVGTTACRTLESAVRFSAEARPPRDAEASPQQLHPNSGPTDIFIFPPYEFKIADGLITNFHIPKSSLMLLVDALLENKKAKRHILDLYKIAIENKFRFYSFGDAMLIV